jgi:hypothetical protein
MIPFHPSGVFSPTLASQERNERVTMGLTALLGVAVILMAIADIMPKNPAEFPILGYLLIKNVFVYKYCILFLGFIVLDQVIITCLATVVSIVILYVHSCAYYTKRLPPQLLLKCVGMDGTKLMKKFEV